MATEIIRPGHVVRAAELLSQILADNRMPADARMDSYFKAHKEMGKRDRGVVAELTYGVLRYLRLLEVRLGEEMIHGWAGYQRRVAAYLMVQQGLSLRALEKYVEPDIAKEVAAALRERPMQSLEPAVRLSLPDQVWSLWVDQFGEEDAALIARSLLSSAAADVRVNALKATPEQLQAQLSEAGFVLSLIDGLPGVLRQQGRASIFRTPAFSQGWFEMQDAGSQLVGALLPVAGATKVVDFCAGAGGKTLQIAAAMGNKGSLMAFDVSAHRLDRMRPRLARAGVDNVRITPLANESDAKLKKLRGTQDAVLVDAPCSGSGTWRRSPDMKWRDLDLVHLQQSQLSILNAASRLVRDEGYLVYATCSMFDEENEQVVSRFLQENPSFSRQSARDALHEKGYLLADSMLTEQGALQTRPDLHEMDGFYAVLFQKTASQDSDSLE